MSSGTQNWKQVLYQEPTDHWEPLAQDLIGYLGDVLSDPTDDEIRAVLNDPEQISDLMEPLLEGEPGKEREYIISAARRLLWPRRKPDTDLFTEPPLVKSLDLDEEWTEYLRDTDQGALVATSVEVEIRVWRAEATRYGTRLIPVSIPAVIRSDMRPEPGVWIPNEYGAHIRYTAAEYQEEAPGASILVCGEPTPAQIQLLRLAADSGFPIEPRVAGTSWREIEEPG